MITTKEISVSDELYQKERELRNSVLLRPFGLPDYAWEMCDQEASHIIAVDQSAVVGCVILYPLPNTPGVGQLMQMAVDPNYQKKGIGQQLLELLIQVARDKGMHEITCHAREMAVNFYEKIGFKVEGAEFYEVGIKHFNMRLKI